MEAMKMCLVIVIVVMTIAKSLAVPLAYVPKNIIDEIRSHRAVANQIINQSVFGKAKGQSYDRLAAFTDKFGNRIAGSQNLENAIDYMLTVLKADGLENVHGEDVMVPHWVRGKESATLLEPRVQTLNMLGLGGSIGTPPGGITADVMVVRSFEELHRRGSEAKGKIVVFNEEYHGYGTSVKYRDFAADETSKLGGLASLVRSIAPFSINSPHTGWQDYTNGTKQIPTACITIEDAEMLNRMHNRGTKLKINLVMSGKNLPPAKSRNTVAEIVGSKYPEQVVLISGHLDSWDVGQGAMDDGGGAFVSWQALSLMKQLGLKPKRTVRMVLWTAEEEGGFGGQQYYNDHKKDIKNFDIVLESDMGTFRPYGINFTGNAQAYSIMTEVMKLLAPINATMIGPNYTGEDIVSWVKAGVPGGNLWDNIDKYFYFHHSGGDTMTVQDPHEMDLCSAVWAVVAYTVANMEKMLPR